MYPVFALIRGDQVSHAKPYILVAQVSLTIIDFRHAHPCRFTDIGRLWRVYPQAVNKVHALETRIKQNDWLHNQLPTSTIPDDAQKKLHLTGMIR